MTLTLELSPQLEQRLKREAARRGVAAAECTLTLLEEHLPTEDRRAEFVSWIEAWIEEGDAAEHRETGTYLIRSLDEDRSAERPLFPPELEGVSW